MSRDRGGFRRPLRGPRSRYGEKAKAEHDASVQARLAPFPRVEVRHEDDENYVRFFVRTSADKEPEVMVALHYGAIDKDDGEFAQDAPVFKDILAAVQGWVARRLKEAGATVHGFKMGSPDEFFNTDGSRKTDPPKEGGGDSG